MNDNRPNLRKTGSQCGFVLIIGLLLLIVMSLIGVSMMSATSLETRMAGGTRESNIAFQAGEAALRDAEASIEATTSVAADFDGTTAGQLSEADMEPDFFAPATWNADPDDGPINSIEYLTGSLEDYPEMPALGQPRYIIKHIGDVLDEAIVRQSISVSGYGEQLSAPNVSIFRVTARGTSRDGSATTILQSYYGRAY